MQDCYCKGNGKEFMEWFVQLIAPVLTGAKPAEILSFPNDEKHSYRLDAIKSSIKLNRKLFYTEFSYCSKCTKLFIYNINALDETLRDKRNSRFLVQLGYPVEYDFAKCVDVLMNKMKSGNIPDEIGVFLGYPVKDVIGFMGHSSLKLTKVNGWRVYGDPRLSDIRYNDFLKAKEKIREMLNYKSPNYILRAV
jgi:hypothetical protein